MDNAVNKVNSYPVNLKIPYPGKGNRWAIFFRLVLIIPMFILNAALVGVMTISGGLLFLAPLLAILFKKRYPKWWFNWNVALMQFWIRVTAYNLFLTNQYPSMDEQQDIEFTVEYPQPDDLHRLMPLIKWFLAIPHFICLAVLVWVQGIVWIMSWICATIMGRIPKSFFHYMLAVTRWNYRVMGYFLCLFTDQYPPFFSNFDDAENS